jgi:CheY-like chemotaxis protein
LTVDSGLVTKSSDPFAFIGFGNDRGPRTAETLPSIPAQPPAPAPPPQQAAAPQHLQPPAAYAPPAAQAAAPFTLQPGDRIGALEIRSMLGAGGMGKVFEAFDRDLMRTVAVKVAGDHPDAPPVREEARALAAISSPSVVTVHAVGLHRGIDYLVMERVYGVSLEERLEEQRQRNAPLPLPEALHLVSSLAEGLAVIHQAGIVHWDLKPANVMLTPGGRVVLLDFGIFVPAFAAAHAPMFRGTPAYSAPEAIRGAVEPPDAHLVDAYALGVLGYELLTGNLPFDAPTVNEIWDLHQAAPVPDVRMLRPEVPAGVALVLIELMAKDPADRPQVMAEVLRRLQAVQRPAAQPDRQRQPSILIVEDEPATLRLIEAYVRKTAPGAEVRTAMRADDALRLIRVSQPDLLLLDLKLPDMTGIDLCLHLRGIGLADRCRIVPVSAAPDQADRRLLLQLGLTQAVQKGPGALEHIGAVIRETFRLLGRPLQ